MCQLKVDIIVPWFTPDVGHLAQAIGIEPLDGFDYLRMNGAAPALQQAAVGDFVRERLFPDLEYTFKHARASYKNSAACRSDRALEDVVPSIAWLLDALEPHSPFLSLSSRC